MSVTALVDYEIGNLRSAEKALCEAARRAPDAQDVVVTADPEALLAADRIVLPGVGAFRACMEALDARDGLREALTEAVRVRGKPFLGVCVGMQMLAERGLEFGATPGLGWIPGEVRRLETREPDAKVPHMGWNSVRAETPHPLIEDGRDLYFTHSFAIHPAAVGATIASVEHGGRFTAAVAEGNVAGVQFHPEKSQAAGLEMIGRFLAWTP